MNAETRAALDAIGNFRECLNDPHDFDQTMTQLRAVVDEQAGEIEHWKSHAEEAGAGFSRLCENHARVSARNVRLAEAVAAVKALHHRVPFDPMRHGITFGQTEFPDMCNVPFDGKWPCATVQLIAADAATQDPTP